MAEGINKEIKKEKYYFIAIEQEGKPNSYCIYDSPKYRISELELLNLIKILVKNRRDVSVGRKIMNVVLDSRDYSEEIYEKLKKEAGLEIDENDRPTISKNNKLFTIIA